MPHNDFSLLALSRRVAASVGAPRRGALTPFVVGLVLATPSLGAQTAQDAPGTATPTAVRSDTAPSTGSTGTPLQRRATTPQPLAPLVSSQPFCLDSIVDMASGSCVGASSTPTLGLLFPYPGINNTLGGPAAFVGGGEGNLAGGVWSTVGGGNNNVASGDMATIAGGKDNTASFTDCTVGGGELNSASAGGATVGGGGDNAASGAASTIAGGQSNTAAGINATVPGGKANTASGNWSLAAGLRAKATHTGAFVWGDSNNVDKPSSAMNEFNVYASGGVRLFSDSSATTGALLAAGSGTWSMLSDRNAKENIEPVDAGEILERVLAMPLSTWNYREQGASVRHLGPMAQDFHEAFGLGVSDTRIDSVDPDGVALAAIQGLNAELRAEIAALRLEKDAALEALLARLERLEGAQRTR